MLENLYTTKMSTSKRQLQNRFTKIRSGSGRVSKIMAFIAFVALLLTMGVSTIVIAANVKNDEYAMTENEFSTGDNYASAAQVTEYIPGDIKDITDAELVVGGIKYPLADTNAHAEIEKAFSSAKKIIMGGPSCPFDAKLIFTKKGGEKGAVTIATDSCAVFKSGDTYYDYGEDNSMLLGYFGLDVNTVMNLTTISKAYIDNSETAVRSFFAAFDQSDLEEMKTLVTNEFIAQGYIGVYGMCYGMTRATLEDCSKANADEFLNEYLARSENNQLPALSENDIKLLKANSDKLKVYKVTVTAESNIKGETKPSFKRFLNVICKKQNNGSWLVHGLEG